MMAPPVRRKKGLLLEALSSNGGKSANTSTGDIDESSKKRNNSDLDDNEWERKNLDLLNDLELD